VTHYAGKIYGTWRPRSTIMAVQCRWCVRRNGTGLSPRCSPQRPNLGSFPQSNRSRAKNGKRNGIQL